MQQRKALGKGLASLIPGEIVTKVAGEGGVPYEMVSIEAILPNRLQPRQEFSDESLNDLASSIKNNGIVQPLIVTTPVSGRYELIAGERRLRAARIAGLEKVPVIVKQADPEMMLEIALIENLQREDLNPIEEAHAYKEMIDNFEYTQEEVAEKISKSRPHVANTLRLLYLPKVIQEDVILGRMSPGHARALLGVSDLQEQLKVREHILQSNLTVRDLEIYIQEMLKGGKPGIKTGKKRHDLTPQLKAAQNEMTEQLGTKVMICQKSGKKGGKIVIEYYTAQDLNRIYKKIVSD